MKGCLVREKFGRKMREKLRMTREWRLRLTFFIFYFGFDFLELFLQWKSTDSQVEGKKQVQ